MTRLPLLLLVVITLARFLAAAFAPVTPAEAYFWMQAQRLDWAYFEMPGGTAALVHLGEVLGGNQPLALRWFAPVAALVATLALHALARRWFGDAVALVAALALNALPLFNAAAVHAGPQMPALALALLATAAFARALENRPLTALAAGSSAALALQFSYAAALLPLAFALTTLASRQSRAQWRHPALVITIALSVLGALPAFLWNHAHSWPMAALGTLRSVLTPDGPALPAALANLGALLGWPVLLASLAGLGLAAARGRHHVKPRLGLLLATPFLLFSLHATLLDAAPETLLLLAAALALPPAAAALATIRSGRLLGTAAVALTAVLTAFGPAADSWSRSAAAAPWAAVAGQIRTLLAQLPTSGQPPFLIAPTADATAALGFHLAGTGSEVYLRESQDLSNQFGLWPRYDDFVRTARPADEFFQLEGNSTNPNLGRSALYLTEEQPADLPQTITAAFGRVTPHATLALPDGRKLRVYLCENYQTMPL